MPDDNVTLNINFFNGTSRFQKSEADSAVNLAISNVGFKMAKNRQRRLVANLQRDFAPVVERELQDMARDVGRLGLGMANFRNPPPGVLTTPGRISKPMIGNSGPMTIASVTGVWAVRSKAYMKSKFKKYNTRRWFYNTGRLQAALSKVGTYRNAYGPVSIRFTPAGISEGTVYSKLGRSSGGQASRIQIGRLEVTPLRRLSLSDLPGIGQQASYNEKLLSPLASSVQRKLKGHPSKDYRPVIEPFLTYYLTRRIPNAVYRRLEDSLA